MLIHGVTNHLLIGMILQVSFKYHVGYLLLDLSRPIIEIALGGIPIIWFYNPYNKGQQRE